MPQLIDMTGQRYGRLIVLCVDHRNAKNRKYYWKCKCDCGREVVVDGINLRTGNTKSCGCLGEENRKRLETNFTKKFGKHGLSDSRLNRIYRHMKERCLSKNNGDYELYGARGISICDEWLGDEGFMNFYNWSMSNGYDPGLSIDRIDVNGDYSPSNCRWATAKEQANNRRTNAVYDVGNGPQTRAQLSEEYGVPYGKIRDRIESGWTPREAVGLDERRPRKAV